jgi:hypothetical protein
MWLQVRGDVLHIYMGTDGLSWDGVFLTHSLANPANHSHGSWIVPHRYYGNSASRCVLYVCMWMREREWEREGERDDVWVSVGGRVAGARISVDTHNTGLPLHLHVPGWKILARLNFTGHTISAALWYNYAEVMVLVTGEMSQSNTVPRHWKVWW